MSFDILLRWGGMQCLEDQITTQDNTYRRMRNGRTCLLEPKQKYLRLVALLLAPFGYNSG